MYTCTYVYVYIHKLIFCLELTKPNVILWINKIGGLDVVCLNENWHNVAYYFVVCNIRKIKDIDIVILWLI